MEKSNKLCLSGYCKQENEKLVYCESCFVHKRSQLEMISKLYSANYTQMMQYKEENDKLKEQLKYIANCISI